MNIPKELVLTGTPSMPVSVIQGRNDSQLLTLCRAALGITRISEWRYAGMKCGFSHRLLYFAAYKGGSYHHSPQSGRRSRFVVYVWSRSEDHLWY